MTTLTRKNEHLTDAQIQFFSTFGFLHLRAIFTPDEVHGFIAELLSQFAHQRSGAPFDGIHRQQIDAFVEHSVLLSPLATDFRILAPVSQLLGDDCIWIGSDGNLYVGNTGWHPDGSNLKYKRIKALIYLETLTTNLGALRVIPSSHKSPLHFELLPLLQRSDKSITPYGVVAPLRDEIAARPLGACVLDLPHFSVETIPGDVVLFDQNLWHSSYGGRAGRMMFTLNYGQAPVGVDHLAYVRQMYDGQRSFMSTIQLLKYESLFPREFLERNRQAEICSLLRVGQELGYVS